MSDDCHADAQPCPYCGEKPLLELFEVWSTREFMLDTCCECMLEEATARLNDPRDAVALLRATGIEAFGFGRLRRLVSESCGSLLLDWNPRIVTVSQARAKAFVREHHAHCPPPAGWRFGAGLCNGHELIGVVMVGRPVARRLDPARVVEVNRLCIRRDLPHGLTWNACSMLYAWSAREAKARGYDRIVTYTLDSEPGTTLRAAGWDRDGASRGGSWSRAQRPRTDRHPTGAKVRWSRPLGARRHTPSASEPVHDIS